MMLKGKFEFDIFKQNFNGANSFPTASSLDQVAERINEKIAWIKEWGTLMNIMEMKGWTEPLTGDIHIVLRAGKMVSAEHIADAAEIVKEDPK